MLEMIRSRLGELRKICVLHGVLRLDVFGSAVEGGFDPDRSDIDFLVEFKPCTPGEHYARYFGLLEALGALFGRSVDLIERGALRNPYVIRRVNEAAVSLYAA